MSVTVELEIPCAVSLDVGLVPTLETNVVSSVPVDEYRRRPLLFPTKILPEVSMASTELDVTAKVASRTPAGENFLTFDPDKR